MPRKQLTWSALRELAFRQWMGVMSYKYREMYKSWCADHGLVPDYTVGYYEFLCLLTDGEKEG